MGQVERKDDPLHVWRPRAVLGKPMINMYETDEFRTAEHTCRVLGLPSSIAEQHTFQKGCKYVRPYIERKTKCKGCRLEREMRTAKEVAEKLER